MADESSYAKISGEITNDPPPPEEETSLTALLEETAAANEGLTVEPGGVKVLAATLRRHHDDILAMRGEVQQIRAACDRLLEKLPPNGFRMYVPKEIPNDQPPA